LPELLMTLRKSDLAAAMSLWPQLQGATARLVNHSENHTFRFDAPGRPSYMLRVHRPDYQNGDTISSELTWMAALRRDTALPIPLPLAGANGQLLQRFETPDGEGRFAVLFDLLPGSEPTPEQDLEGLFRVLGDYAARMHLHVMDWQRPEGFQRQAWTAESILDADGLWGDWRKGPDVDATLRATLDCLDAALREDLAAYGTSGDRYGLVHADMRLGNVLVDGEHVSLIDFDDCGFCWFTYDFAAAISFHETHASVPALKAAWLDGYRGVRPLSASDIATLDTMILLRRMALLAWIGSHAETTLAQTHAPGFAKGTADLAERYLAVRRAAWG